MGSIVLRCTNLDTIDLNIDLVVGTGVGGGGVEIGFELYTLSLLLFITILSHLVLLN